MSSQRGAAAEQIAADFLTAHGLQVLIKNYRCRVGEIDLIARDDGTLCFVEVRYRRSESYGTPTATVDSKKQQRIIRAATHFLFTQGGDGHFPSRFDVISITGELRTSDGGTTSRSREGAIHRRNESAIDTRNDVAIHPRNEVAIHPRNDVAIQWIKNAFELSGWGAG